jgi:hypothetical protein
MKGMNLKLNLKQLFSDEDLTVPYVNYQKLRKTTLSKGSAGEIFRHWCCENHAHIKILSKTYVTKNKGRPTVEQVISQHHLASKAKVHKFVPRAVGQQYTYELNIRLQLNTC